MKELSPYQKSAVEYDEHIALTANAGSGKTFVLAKRYVEVVLKNEIPLSSIVAITFTDKAAGELYTRITKEIDERLEFAKDEKDISILRRMRRQIVSAKISTIHSFCIELLREFAPYVDLDINFAPIDKRHSGELLQQSIEDIYSQLLNEDDTALKELIRFFGSKNLFVNEIEKLFGKRKTVEAIVQDIQNSSEDELIEKWEGIFKEKFISQFGDMLAEIFYSAKTINDFVLSTYPSNEYARQAKNFLDSSLELNSDNLFELLMDFNNLKKIILTQKLSLRSQNYLKKKDKENFRGEVDLIEKNVQELKFLDFDSNFQEVERNLVEVVKNLSELFTQINKEYKLRKKRNNFLDFEDILLLARELLAKEEVRAQLSGKFKFIMVDEYQDTNDIQYEIILPLIEEFKKGKLFIVGDEKQSIYSFREADLKIFYKTRDEIAASTDEKGVLSLPHSFRLAPNLAAFVNFIFRRLFYQPNEEFNEVNASDLICSKVSEFEGNIEFVINSDKEETEANLTAKKILSLLNKGRSAGEIAVLCRKRSHFAELTDCLGKYEIPYTVIGSKGFYENQIIIDFQNYLSFLINKFDDTALISVLRSPFFYLPDTVIYEINLLSGKSYFEKLKKYSQTHTEYRAVIEILEEHIQLASSESIANLLRKIIESTGIIATISKREFSEIEFATIEKFIDLAVSFQSDSFSTLYDFVEFVNAAVEKDTDESQAELFTDGDKIKVMTIHQSKGLEFPVVFLYKSNSKFRVDSVQAKTILVDKEFGFVTKSYPGSYYFSEPKHTPHTCLYSYYLNKRQVAEEYRLLYVALTRAEEEIFITADLTKGRIEKLSYFGALSSVLKYEQNMDNISIRESLSFMDPAAGFTKKEKIISFQIPVTYEIDDVQGTSKISDEESQAIKFLTGAISDYPKNEIFSATKIAVFNQCPLKYDLIYNNGLSKLQSLLKRDIINDDFNSLEDNSEVDIPANIKGSLIHKILEKNAHGSEIEKIITEDLSMLEPDDYSFNKIKEEINELISNFYASDVYEKIQSFTDFKNEQEIYYRKAAYYLYGILDKIIFNENKIIVVDYKTDLMQDISPEEKLETYKIQLLFYAYLVKQAYPKVEQIEVMLIFIREPEKSISQIIGNEELIRIENKLTSIIDSISDNRYEKNLEHCVKCQFSNKLGKCIVGG